MLGPVGLAPFQQEFPTRTFDVGIAEQHAATSAAGMAFAGLHPVVAVYATFLNRAFDQVLMDVALHRAGVTFVLDRAGITGEDGASHNGMWDLAMLRIVPGLRLAAPRDEPTLRAALRAAVDVDDAPTVVRYPKGAVADPVPAVEDVDGVDVVRRSSASPEAPRVLVVGIGSMVPTALAVEEILATHGLSVTVAAPTWVLPLPDALVKMTGEHDVVLTLEDGLAAGGVGALLVEEAMRAGHRTRILTAGLPTAFLDHATIDQVVTSNRLTAPDLARDVLDALGT